ncbi:V-type H+-transporting ATPase subunit d [Pancytospora epiphaga]|nr:V-type H+-transporting ATPase subunit d [Pancytospora epiphaga]
MSRSIDNDYAFVIADINGRYNQMLKDDDYTILSHCRTFEEFIIKLNQHFPFINEDMTFTVSELRSKLYLNIVNELDECKAIPLLKYFIELNKIQVFFTTLETGEEPLLAGAIEEFKGLSACKSFEEARKLYIQGGYLEKYFYGVKIKDSEENNNIQEAMLRVVKNCLDYHYAKVTGGYIKEIMEAEGDKLMIEICMNGKQLRNKLEYFPRAGNISWNLRSKLIECETYEELAMLVCPGSNDPLVEMLCRVSQVYAGSFRQFGDLSCVYAYFRLKEQEIRNILWISECILQGDYEKIRDVVTTTFN